MKTVNEATTTLESEFEELANRWYSETRMLSFARQKAMHPAYQQIIGMGKEALPLIFQELKERGGDWLWALESITRLGEKNPAHGKTKFKEAVAAWLQWGRENGYAS